MLTNMGRCTSCVDMLKVSVIDNKRGFRVYRLKPNLESSALGDWDTFSFRCLLLSGTNYCEHKNSLSWSRGRSKDVLGIILSTSFGGVFEVESQVVTSVQRRCIPLMSRYVSPRAFSGQSDLQTAEHLRDQLESLQQEAEQVRGRANSARMRFMRLTHVVEQLRQRAAMDVKIGKEESARSLLTEKQKVMKALEAARQRAELLEKLAGKLNVSMDMITIGAISNHLEARSTVQEGNMKLDMVCSSEWGTEIVLRCGAAVFGECKQAISLKESQLIGALSTAPLSMSSDTSEDSAVHVVSPKIKQDGEEDNDARKLHINRNRM